jgi:hypothetical protein
MAVPCGLAEAARLAGLDESVTVSERAEAEYLLQ